jgi:predicted transcriptional regulator
MKTTFDLPESLVREVKRIARERGTTARALVQQALTRVVDDATQPTVFVLPDASVEAWESMTPEAKGKSIHELVLMSYDNEV